MLILYMLSLLTSVQDCLQGYCNFCGAKRKGLKAGFRFVKHEFQLETLPSPVYGYAASERGGKAGRVLLTSSAHHLTIALLTESAINAIALIAKHCSSQNEIKSVIMERFRSGFRLEWNVQAFKILTSAD